MQIWYRITIITWMDQPQNDLVLKPNCKRTKDSGAHRSADRSPPECQWPSYPAALALAYMNRAH